MGTCMPWCDAVRRAFASHDPNRVPDLQPGALMKLEYTCDRCRLPSPSADFLCPRCGHVQNAWDGAIDVAFTVIQQPTDPKSAMQTEAPGRPLIVSQPGREGNQEPKSVEEDCNRVL